MNGGEIIVKIQKSVPLKLLLPYALYLANWRQRQLAQYFVYFANVGSTQY